MNLLPFLILILSMPFGIAFQCLALVVVSFWILIKKRHDLKTWRLQVGHQESRSIGLILMVAIFQMGATLLNPANPTRDIFSFLMGYLPLILLPCLFVLMPKLEANDLARLEKVWTGVMIFWSLLVISQALKGWHISGIAFELGDTYRRSQGFYSHPLTMAYVALMLWPFHLVLLCTDPRKINRCIMLTSNLLLLYFSASRTAQAVALLSTVGFMFYYFRGRHRWFVLVGLVLAIGGIFSTNNTVSRRFMSMTSHISEEKESSYPDDRIAFWVVHYIMVKERPFMGHGINLDKPYRVPYYEAIGLHNFKKAYEAHNQILQLAAEGGLGAALAFIFWLGSLHFNWLNGPQALKWIRDLTVSCLFFGGLTQNAYFDGEVRYALMTLMALAFAMGYGRTRAEDTAASETLIAAPLS
ncbi:MAG: O-antigen ligase family protein [Chitinophagaceae bacterium]|nr:O-antigen ligase family protein [Oligoflexus sp.]